MDSISLTRREVILASSQVVITSLFSSAAFASTEDPRQRGWRFCTACYSMFFGPEQAGVCPAGAAHQPAGYRFAIHKRLTEQSQQEQAPPQDKWRKCRKCYSLFYNGFQQKGACAARGVHSMDPAIQFFLSHDRVPYRNEQTEWRFCKKCNGLFFDGYPKKGLCPGGGEHDKAGYFFMIPYV